MKLMEILEEVQKIKDGTVDTLTEAKRNIKNKKTRKIAYANRKIKLKAEKIAKELKARPGKINWTKDVIKTRDKIIDAFIENDPKTVIKMIQRPTTGYITIEILKALEKAHRGYEKLEKAAGKKKHFIKTVYAYLDKLEDSSDDE